MFNFFNEMNELCIVKLLVNSLVLYIGLTLIDSQTGTGCNCLMFIRKLTQLKGKPHVA